MKQLTKEEAIKIYKSEAWKAWTHSEIFNFQIRQEKLCVPFDIFHKATEYVLGRDVYTHEFAHPESLINESLFGNKPTIQEIIDMLPKDKVIIGLYCPELA